MKLPHSLGAAGLIPFLGGTFFAYRLDDPAGAKTALVFYAVAILSFLGGVHWGRALQTADTGGASRSARLYVFSVIPSIAAWLAFAMPQTTALLYLAGCFVAFWIAEKAITTLPAFYAGLRTALTITVTSALIIASFAR